VEGDSVIEKEIRKTKDRREEEREIEQRGGPRPRAERRNIADFVDFFTNRNSAATLRRFL